MRFRDLKEIFFKLRQLAGAFQCFFVNQIWGVGLFVAVLFTVGVEHKLRQCTMQACHLARHGNKARTGYGCAGIKAHAQWFTQVDVVFGFKAELGGFAPYRHFDVVVFIVAMRHGILRHIGNRHQKLTQCNLGRFCCGFGIADVGVDAAHDLSLSIFR